MSTLKRLESQFNALLLPVEVVRAHFFPHLSEDTFKRRARSNGFGFPVVTADRSQKAAMFVHIEDLAAYLDSRRTVAMREHGYLASVMRPPLLEAPSPDDFIPIEQSPVSKRKTV